MKKIFLFSLLASLGVAIGFISAINTSSYTERISYNNGKYKSQKAWVSVVLSYDKTKMFMINVTEQTEARRSINSSILYSVTRYDTIKTFIVQKEARIFLSDSNLDEIINGGVINLPDSIVPRWNQFFCKDRLIKRSISIINGQVSVFTITENVVAKDTILSLLGCLVIIILFLVINFMLIPNVIEGSIIMLILAIIISIIMIAIKPIEEPWFNTIIIVFSLLIGNIISIVVKKRKIGNY